MDKRKYWTLCRLHDWHYMMSDDPEVYRNGADYERMLEEFAKESPEHAEVYEAWRDHHYNCGPVPKEPKMKDAQ